MLDNIVARFHDVKAKRERGEGGFTLIELLVVVVIIGILIAIAIPLYLNYQRGAKDKSSQSDLRALVSTIQQCYTDNSNAYPTAGTQTAAGADMTFTGCTATGKASDGSVLTYAYTAAVTSGTVAPAKFVITAKNSDGNNKTYSYDSSVGGGIK